MERKSPKIRKLTSFIFTVIVIIIGVVVYKKYNFNDFNKNISEPNKTVFTRDSEVKYSKMDSYKIENTDYHDAMFSQKISVIPNVPYKVTCKVKLQDVENLNNTISGGAQICISGTTERSKTISGTKDWQELTMYFNAKNRTEVEVGFRLGGYAEKSKGTAWFSDFEVEVGTANKSNNWKMVCFIFPNIDVNVTVNGKKEHVKLQMTDRDIQNVKLDMQRYKNSISEISKNKIKIEYDLFTITDPIKTLSYDDENGYYISENDVYNYINDYVEKNEYDHIYVACRMSDKQKGNHALVNDWIGLGGMEYLGIGFSNIRMPDDENNYAYQFSYLINTFPEEVFLHEFLHTMERNSESYGYEIPLLHDYEKYGYSEDRLEGLKKWYTDYMNKEIVYNGKKIGVEPDLYNCKPVHESNFKYSTKVDALKEPSNVIEVIKSICRRIGSLFEYLGERNIQTNNEEIKVSN